MSDRTPLLAEAADTAVEVGDKAVGVVKSIDFSSLKKGMCFPCTSSHKKR